MKFLQWLKRQRPQQQQHAIEVHEDGTFTIAGDDALWMRMLTEAALRDAYLRSLSRESKAGNRST